MISAHLYPYSVCLERSSPSYPTISRVLSEHATAGLAKAIRPAVALAHRAGLPLRLTELNSVTCGGLAGVSNTFATALWAPDALFELMNAGVDGVNVHIRAPANQTITPGPRGYQLTIPRLSAELPTVRLRPGALTDAHSRHAHSRKARARNLHRKPSQPRFSR